MLKTGVCSVTFRSEEIDTIISLAAQVGLDGIEWGGDIHVPPGKYDLATSTGKKTKQAGLEVSSYGSYYCLGSASQEWSFETILKTAICLGAPSIRVWAGEKASCETSDEEWLEIVEDARRIANLARKVKIEIHLEYHGGTLTDTSVSACRLMKEIDHPNVYLYWQPAVDEEVLSRIQSIHSIRKWLKHVHVFFWKGVKRYPLEDGLDDWRKYVKAVQNDQQSRYYMLEFVRDDHKSQFVRDAATLKFLLSTLHE